MNEIKTKIYQFIKDKLGVEEAMIKDDSSFKDDLEVDSLDYSELILNIEKGFNLQIPDDKYERLQTVGALVDYVSKQLSSHHPKLAVVNIDDHPVKRVS